MEYIEPSKYHKNIIQGLKSLAKVLEEIDPEELYRRIKKHEHIANQYAVLERSLLEELD